MTTPLTAPRSAIPFARRSALSLLSAALLAGGATGCAAPRSATTPPTTAPQAAPQAAPTAAPIVARALPTFPLWASGAPGALGGDSTDRPAMTPYLPPPGRATGAAVVIFPGGGYQHLSMEKEGSDIANWLASHGVTAFVVRYRLGPRYRHPAMLNDAQRAIRTVRARAAEWGVDPARIGILGSSAGGHLASTAGTHFDAGAPTAADPIERAGSRPDLMVLLYPVITMRDSITHRGSRRNLIGEPADPALVALLSNETRVTRETPRTFIVTSTDDRTVPVENSLLFFAALRRAAVPAELHAFETGPHGFGLAPRDPVISVWPRLCEAWLRRNGWLAPRP